ncbi:DEAD/DEAH box helicase family protein [Brevibacillus parabrevis]|jgi:DNA or RNA helicases of superfamily II|uniref:DEAD/DEAH box helicase n=1 Tax=Brevibacillus parabrevis TaxID=54914 RepID=UPI002490BF04|nr:DEAD/DEAH box helicase family protein [Brevibacillus parabrevis]
MFQKFDERYFLNANPNILENTGELREPQYEAYLDICKHYLVDKSSDHAVVVLPTGAGKTGVIALAPYGISHGRVLIITPQLVIKDHVMESLDPSSPENFWLARKVFETYSELPIVTEYDKDTLQEELEKSNIVILNIHKLTTAHRNSLLNRVGENFFDMIIIDEAHHSPAETWQEALRYFSGAKVLKVTGTPFRTDRKPIEGLVVTNYRLGKAMALGIVKTLENFRLIPEKVYLTIGDNPTRYTLEEIRKLGIKDEEFISKSVALSPECNKQIVEASIEELNERKNASDVPHKIIGVCCSINHAQAVKSLYEDAGLRTVVVHSKMPKTEKEEALRKVESHQVDAVLHVAMLGEGYDHRYLSVAAIFRPYRSLAPYAQFIGRILRSVPKEEVRSPKDNIGVVIAHRDLGLDPLWDEYKKESEYCDVLKMVQQQEKSERKLEKVLRNPSAQEIGTVTLEGDLYYSSEYYEYTEAASKQEEYEKVIAERVKKLRDLLPNHSETELRKMVLQQDRPTDTNPLLKNPKKFRMMVRTSFDHKIKHDIPTQILVDAGLKKEGFELTQLPLRTDMRWVLEVGDNAAIIAVYLTVMLQKKYGDRQKWTIEDFGYAERDLPQIIVHLEKMIRSVTNG